MIDLFARLTAAGAKILLTAHAAFWLEGAEQIRLGGVTDADLLAMLGERLGADLDADTAQTWRPVLDLANGNPMALHILTDWCLALPEQGAPELRGLVTSSCPVGIRRCPQSRGPPWKRGLDTSSGSQTGTCSPSCCPSSVMRPSRNWKPFAGPALPTTWRRSSTSAPNSGLSCSSGSGRAAWRGGRTKGTSNCTRCSPPPCWQVMARASAESG